MGILEEIIAHKEVKAINYVRSRELRSFTKAIEKTNQMGKVALIAEIKPKSPSSGEIKNILNIIDFAMEYEDNGASCISILTEYNYFGGNIEHLRMISQIVKVPLLRKDFITNSGEIYDSYNLNADAILLIVAILGKNLNKYLNECKKIGLEAVVEVHTRDELAIALKAGAEIIGINNRNLDTLDVNLEITKDLAKFVPRNKLLISESGIRSSQDIENLTPCGINAVLVGTEIMKSENMAKTINELSNVRFIHD